MPSSWLEDLDTEQIVITEENAPQVSAPPSSVAAQVLMDRSPVEPDQRSESSFVGIRAPPRTTQERYPPEAISDYHRSVMQSDGYYAGLWCVSNIEREFEPTMEPFDAPWSHVSLLHFAMGTNPRFRLSLTCTYYLYLTAAYENNIRNSTIDKWDIAYSAVEHVSRQFGPIPESVEFRDGEHRKTQNVPSVLGTFINEWLVWLTPAGEELPVASTITAPDASRDSGVWALQLRYASHKNPSRPNSMDRMEIHAKKVQIAESFILLLRFKSKAFKIMLPSDIMRGIMDGHVHDAIESDFLSQRGPDRYYPETLNQDITLVNVFVKFKSLVFLYDDRRTRTHKDRPVTILDCFHSAVHYKYTKKDEKPRESLTRYLNGNVLSVLYLGNRVSSDTLKTKIEELEAVLAHSDPEAILDVIGFKDITDIAVSLLKNVSSMLNYQRGLHGGNVLFSVKDLYTLFADAPNVERPTKTRKVFGAPVHRPSEKDAIELFDAVCSHYIQMSHFGPFGCIEQDPNSRACSGTHVIVVEPVLHRERRFITFYCMLWNDQASEVIQLDAIQQFPPTNVAPLLGTALQSHLFCTREPGQPYGREWKMKELVESTDSDLVFDAEPLVGLDQDSENNERLLSYGDIMKKLRSNIDKDPTSSTSTYDTTSISSVVTGRDMARALDPDKAPVDAKYPAIMSLQNGTPIQCIAIPKSATKGLLVTRPELIHEDTIFGAKLLWPKGLCYYYRGDKQNISDSLNLDILHAVYEKSDSASAMDILRAVCSSGDQMYQVVRVSPLGRIDIRTSAKEMGNYSVYENKTLSIDVAPMFLFRGVDRIMGMRPDPNRLRVLFVPDSKYACIVDNIDNLDINKHGTVTISCAKKYHSGKYIVLDTHRLLLPRASASHSTMSSLHWFVTFNVTVDDGASLDTEPETSPYSLESIIAHNGTLAGSVGKEYCPVSRVSDLISSEKEPSLWLYSPDGRYERRLLFSQREHSCDYFRASYKHMNAGALAQVIQKTQIQDNEKRWPWACVSPANIDRLMQQHAFSGLYQGSIPRFFVNKYSLLQEVPIPRKTVTATTHIVRCVSSHASAPMPSNYPHKLVEACSGTRAGASVILPWYDAFYGLWECAVDTAQIAKCFIASQATHRYLSVQHHIRNLSKNRTETTEQLIQNAERQTIDGLEDVPVGEAYLRDFVNYIKNIQFNALNVVRSGTALTYTEESHQETLVAMHNILTEHKTRLSALLECLKNPLEGIRSYVLVYKDSSRLSKRDMQDDARRLIRTILEHQDKINRMLGFAFKEIGSLEVNGVLIRDAICTLLLLQTE